jgi:hypothetical protein
MLIRTRLTGARYSALRCRLQSRGSLRGLPRSSDVICGIGATAPRVRPQPNRGSSTTDRVSNSLTSRTNRNRIPRPKWLIFSKHRARLAQFRELRDRSRGTPLSRTSKPHGHAQTHVSGTAFRSEVGGTGSPRTSDRRSGATRPADRDGAACGFRGQRRLWGPAQPGIVSAEPSLWRLDVLRAG